MRNNPRKQQIENMRRLNEAWGRDTTPNSFFDAWERDFDRTARRTFWGIFTVWAVGIVLSLIFWGVVIWGIIELVQWVQTK